MTFTHDDIPSQSGRTILITGASSGLGLETALRLVVKGGHVIMACRSEERAKEAMGKIQKAIEGAEGAGTYEFLQMDVSEPESVKTASAEMKKRFDKLDLVVLNAGVMAIPTRAQNSKGWEMQMATNHLGHFLLIHEILPLISKGKNARISIVSSLAQRFAPKFGIDFNVGQFPTYDGQGAYDPFGVYAQTKLANMLFMHELQDRLDSKGIPITCTASHPGWTSTNLQGGKFPLGLEKILNPILGMSVERGTLSQLQACVDPDAKPRDFYGPGWGMFGNPTRNPTWGAYNPICKDKRLTAKLWQESEQALGIELLH